jgi:hypothetical protein
MLRDDTMVPRPPPAAARARLLLDRSSAEALSTWHVLRFLVVLVPLYQVVYILWAIWTRTPHVPYWDEWATVVLVHKADQGTLQIGDFFAFHNEHRIVLPRIIHLILIELTHWNRQILMTLNICVAIGTAVLLFSCLRRTLRSADVALLLSVPVSLLFFSFAQYENWVWAFQLTFLLTVLGAVLCLWAALTEHPGWRAWGLAVLGALIATLSALPGLLVWVAFLPAIFRMGRRKALAWIGVAIPVWILYFNGFPHEASHPARIGDAINYVLVYLGAPLGYPDVDRSRDFGLVGILLLLANLLVYWVLRREFRSILPWIGLALFSFGTAAITAYGREYLGIVQAEKATRYQAFSIMWWITLVVMIGASIEQVAFTLQAKQRPRILAPRALAVGILSINLIALLLGCGSLALVNQAGYGELVTFQADQKRNEDCILHYRSATDACLQIYFPDPAQVRVLASYLEHDHLGIFYGAPPSHPSISGAPR